MRSLALHGPYTGACVVFRTSIVELRRTGRFASVPISADLLRHAQFRSHATCHAAPVGVIYVFRRPDRGSLIALQSIFDRVFYRPCVDGDAYR